MPRFMITIEYDGRGFAGWQHQENALSVQQVVEEAITGFCGEAVTTHVAGRTDAGVHALGQVAHFDLSRDHAPDTVRNAVNFHLKPAPVSIIDARRVDDDFHARFSARRRVYLYRILDRPAPPALDRGRVWWLPSRLDEGAMAEAARVLLGKHDFTSFRASVCQAKSPVKTLDGLDVERRGAEIVVLARARSFMHHQVRAMVGTMKLVGEGKWRADDVAAALAARDRAAGGPTAPAEGLYLSEVEY